MYNLQPGLGLGETPSKMLAFNLGSPWSDIIEAVIYMHKFVGQAIQMAFEANMDD